MNNQSNTGRYSIGQKLVTVSVRVQRPGFEGEASRLSWNTSLPSYLDYTVHGITVHSVVFRVLEVIEHHRVSGDWDDEVKYDGYILRDVVDGLLWTNQYPHASYGQVSDAADRIFMIHENGMSEKEIENFVVKCPYQTRLFSDLVDSYTPTKEDRQRMIDAINKGDKRTTTASMSYIDNTLAKIVRDFKKALGSKYELYDEVWYRSRDVRTNQPYALTRKSVREIGSVGFEGDRINTTPGNIRFDRYPSLKTPKPASLVNAQDVYKEFPTTTGSV